MLREGGLWEFLRRGLRSWLARLERPVRAMPGVERRLEEEYAEVLRGLEPLLKPYRDLPAFHRLPPEGRSPEWVFRHLEALAAREEPRWRKGYASGAVYHGGEPHVAFLNRVYALFSQANPLHPDLWPSVARMEAEIVSMTAHMLGADAAGEEIVGTVTSCGTESILLAMKAYRDWARETRGIVRPEVVLPVTAHAAFEKAAQLLGLRLIYVPVDAGYRADVDGHGPGDHPSHHRPGGLRALLPPRRHRPCPGDRGPGPGARDRLPRGCMPGRVHPAVGGTAGLSRPSLRFPAARRDLDLRRSAQIRIRAEGRLGDPVSGKGAAPLSVFRGHGLAGGSLRHPHAAGEPPGRPDRRGLGGDDRAGGARVDNCWQFYYHLFRP
jgi:hypothetical protein